MGLLQEFMIDELNYMFIYHGPMRSGKTSTIIKDLTELQEHSPWQDHIIVFRPTNDTRKTEESGSGHGFESLPNFHWLDANNSYEHMFDILKQYDIYRSKKYGGKFIIGTDEGGFFDSSLVDALVQLSEMGINNVTSSLGEDYRRYPFANIETLLTIIPHKWQIQFSSSCECLNKGERCKYPARYTQRETLIKGIWRPSSFFEATVIPEGHPDYKYSVVCAKHHKVRHLPIDRFGNRDLYQTQLRELQKAFVDKDSELYTRCQKEFINQAKERGVIKK